MNFDNGEDIEGNEDMVQNESQGQIKAEIEVEVSQPEVAEEKAAESEIRYEDSQPEVVEEKTAESEIRYEDSQPEVAEEEKAENEIRYEDSQPEVAEEEKAAENEIGQSKKLQVTKETTEPNFNITRSVESWEAMLDEEEELQAKLKPKSKIKIPPLTEENLSGRSNTESQKEADNTFNTSLEPLLKETDVKCDPEERVWQVIESGQDYLPDCSTTVASSNDPRKFESYRSLDALSEKSEIYDIQKSRKTMIKSIRAFTENQGKLTDYNLFLQNKVGEYYRKKFCEFGTAAATLQDIHGLSLDSKFQKFMVVISTLHNERNSLINNLEIKRTEGKKQIIDIQKKVTDKYEEYLTSRKKVISKAVDGRKRPIQISEWQNHFDKEFNDEETIKNLRIPCIKIELNIARMNNAQEEKEKSSGGFRMIDYEQLRTENVALLNQMELNIKEIKKLKCKNLKYLSVLAHCREKSYLLTQLRKITIHELTTLDNDLNSTRNGLHKLKMEKDCTKKDNDHLRKKTGLLGRDALQIHFQDVLDNMRVKKKTVNHGIEEWMGLKKKIHQYQSSIDSIKNKKSKHQVTLPHMTFKISDQFSNSDIK